MELSELKLISASNIINLRTSQNMTQAELGAKLNYSDKTISKWERGEAIPDAYVLTQLAEMFGVSVDYLLTTHDKWETPADEADEPGPSYSVGVIMALAVLGVMTCALTVFVTLWMLDIIEWRVFLVGLSAAILTYLVLDCVFKHGRHLPYNLSAFVLSLFVLAFFFLPPWRWQIFLLAVPALALVWLGCNVKRRPGRLKEKLKKMKKTENEEKDA